jgi:hypothetical protein
LSKVSPCSLPVSVLYFAKISASTSVQLFVRPYQSVLWCRNTEAGGFPYWFTVVDPRSLA